MTDKPAQQHGLLVINKPKGPTSAACIEKIKRKLGQKKIGHAGTLDPMATGVLLVLLGHGTKLASYLGDGTKVYSGTFRLGMTTDTYDMEGEVASETPWEHLDAERIGEAIGHWEQETEQIVPPYSAAKHKGQPLYKLSREGKETPVKIKPLRVTRADVLEIEPPYAKFRVACGTGTYIRSLVHSLGIRLECGAVLTELTRETSGPFSLDAAYELEQLLQEPERFSERVLSLADALPHWPRLTLDQGQSARIKNGMRIPCAELADFLPKGPQERAVMQDSQQQPLALVESVQEDQDLVWAILRGLWNA